MARQRIAAAVLLVRDGGRQLYLAERRPELRFFGGYWACPGGTLEDVDSAEAGELAEALRACAVRELEEEIAVSLPASALVDVCTITTPPFAPVRYQTRFFLAELPPGQEPTVQGDGDWGELTRGRFFAPEQALAGWRRGELAIVPPVLLFLELLSGRTPGEFVAAAAAEAAALEAGKLHPVRFSPGIFVAPLATRTRPPATTTNCLLVGEQRVHIVDPAPTDPGEQQRLTRRLDGLRASGVQLEGVLLTHAHPDHVGALECVRERYDLTVRAHPLTLERLGLGGQGAEAIEDGHVLELGAAPDGSPGWRLTALATPGHAPGHLAFRESRYHALIAGDLISTISTVVIDPPEGHLATYLASLERLLEEPIGTLYPGHGPAVREGAPVVRHYLAHRQAREDALVEALRTRGEARPEELVPIVYSDVDPTLHPLATRSLTAGLIKLAEEGRAREHSGAWSLTTTGDRR